MVEFQKVIACKDCVWPIISDAELYTTCPGERVLVDMQWRKGGGGAVRPWQHFYGGGTMGYAAVGYKPANAIQY